MSEKRAADALPPGLATPRTTSQRPRRRPAILGAVCLLFLGGTFFHQCDPEDSQIHFEEPEDMDPAVSSDVCLTPACVHAASEILYNLSPNYKDLDPCEDFEELVCAGWRDRHDLRPDQGDAFTGTIMVETSQLLLRHILEGEYPESIAGDSLDRDNFNKLRDAYDSCLDEDSIKKAGLKPVLEFLGEMDYSSSAMESHDVIGNATLQLSKYGLSPFISAGTGADDRDPDTVVVSISPPWSFGLPSKQRYEDSKLLKKYRDVTIEVLSNIYPDEDEKTFDQVIELEKKLAAASPDVEEREDVTVRPIRLLTVFPSDQLSRKLTTQ